MKVVVLGSGEMLINLIAGSRDAGCEVVGVFRHEKVRRSPVKRIIKDIFNPSLEYSYIKSYNLYEINATKANSADFKKEILKLNADIILVGNWSEKLKKHIIDLPKIATINVHPSILPKYRGPNPYLQVIKNKERETGVTFHLMDENFDTGEILYQKKIDINPQDTGLELRTKIAAVAREGVCELIEQFDKEVIIPIKQDESSSSYFSNIDENEVMIDFSKPADEIFSKIKALHPWYKCYFSYGKKFFIPDPYKIEILDSNTKKNSPGSIVQAVSKKKSLTILCGDNKLLKFEDLRLYKIPNFLTGFYIKFNIENRIQR